MFLGPQAENHENTAFLLIFFLLLFFFLYRFYLFALKRFAFIDRTLSKRVFPRTMAAESRCFQGLIDRGPPYCVKPV